jgi:uncharacterized membrane protein YhaH (DUF805 family)
MARGKESSLSWVLFYPFIFIIPGFDVTVQKLDDTGRSAWNIFLALIPSIGRLILLSFLLQDSFIGETAIFILSFLFKL